jgi:hypothetical protein
MSLQSAGRSTRPAPRHGTIPVDEPDPLVVVVVLDVLVVVGEPPPNGPGLGPRRPASAAAAAALASVVVVVVGGAEPRDLKGLTGPRLDGGRRSADTGVSVHTNAARATMTMTITVESGVTCAPLRRLGLPDTDIR